MSTVISTEIIAPEVAQQSTDVLTYAKGLKIVSQPQYDGAVTQLRGVVALRKDITDKFAEPKRKAHEAHKAITKFETESLAPVIEAEKLIKGAIGTFDEAKRREQARLEAIAQQEANKRQAEADKLERERQESERRRLEEENLQFAMEIEAAGASPEEVASVLEAPIEVAAAPVPMVIAETVVPVYDKAKGISTQYDYSVEITNLVDLIKYAATSPIYASLVIGHQTSLNSLARAQKEAYSIPGTRLVKRPRVSVR